MRKTAKAAVNLICLLLMLPMSVPVRLLTPEGRQSALFSLICHLLCLLPGTVGVFLRRGYYSVAFSHCGTDVSVGFGTIFAMRGTSIGDGTYIGTHCTIGLANIGDNVLIGSNVDVIGGPKVHNFDRLDVPIKKQGGSISSVTIGSGSWIGNSAVIMANIGKECVIGAGTVVASPCDDWGVYVGNPARRVRDRRDLAVDDNSNE